MNTFTTHSLRSTDSFNAPLISFIVWRKHHDGTMNESAFQENHWILDYCKWCAHQVFGDLSVSSCSQTTNTHFTCIYAFGVGPNQSRTSSKTDANDRRNMQFAFLLSFLSSHIPSMKLWRSLCAMLNRHEEIHFIRRLWMWKWIGWV